MEIKQVTENEMFDLLDAKIEGVYYYINHLGRYYCYLIRSNKRTLNIWNHQEFAFKWMQAVFNTHFAKS